jgi:hypothetical protein
MPTPGRECRHVVASNAIIVLSLSPSTLLGLTQRTTVNSTPIHNLVHLRRLFSNLPYLSGIVCTRTFYLHGKFLRVTVL